MPRWFCVGGFWFGCGLDALCALLVIICLRLCVCVFVMCAFPCLFSSGCVARVDVLAIH